MVQESVEVKHNTAKLIQKVLPTMKYYAATDYWISTESYGDKLSILGGTSQGNSASRVIFRDTSCLIFRYLEQQNSGSTISITSERRMI